MNPVRLLLVEDDPVSRSFLSQALGQFPAHVDAAADAAQAIVLARQHEHALWLLDANLPDASGGALLRRLRSMHPHTPALCLTAEVDAAQLHALGKAGFADVLAKPILVDALHAAVRGQLRAFMPTHGDSAALLPVWDDAQAALALGGNQDAVKALRGLFVSELPLQAAAIASAIAAGDGDAVRAHLHQLKASCGFVGSTRLLAVVRALHDAPLDARHAARFDSAVQEALAAAAGSSNTASPS